MQDDLDEIPLLEFPLRHREDSLSALAICQLEEYQIETVLLTIYLQTICKLKTFR